MVFFFLITELRAYHQSHQYASHSQIFVGQCVCLPDPEEHPEFQPHHLHKFMMTDIPKYFLHIHTNR